MADALILTERIKNAIQIGESDYREFKSALEGPPGKKKPRLLKNICRDIGEALVAFANADGGELLIGVEDDGIISGVPHQEEDIKRMLEAPKTHVHPESTLPLIHALKIELDGKTVLFFAVAKGTTEIYQLPDGRCVRRKDKRTVPETIKKILFDRQEVKSREYDRQFVDGAAVNDLDVPFIQSIADRYLRGLTVEKYLQQIGLADYSVNGLRLRMASLLLFAKEIQRWHPRSQVRILKISGTELKSGEQYNVKSDETIRGNIFELLQNSWEQLRPFLADKTEFGVDAKFEQKYIYPEWACREALINAIAHRDYSIQNGIDVFIFDDRMEIKSPGALLSTITIEDLEKLEGAHESRNVLISRVLRENKFMRELGEGIKRIFELMEQNELDKPKLFSNSIWFTVTLPHKSIFSSQQDQWLALFKSFELSPHQKKIVLLGMDEREISQKDIYRAMNTKDSTIYATEVTGLRKSGLLIEIRTNVEAKSLAFKKKMLKAEVPRFKVQFPPMNENIIEKPDQNSDRCVYVVNLDYSMSENEVKKIFEQIGRVERVDLPKDKVTGNFKGFGFVWFKSVDAAKRAIKEMDGQEIKGRSITVKKYTPSAR